MSVHHDFSGLIIDKENVLLVHENLGDYIAIVFKNRDHKEYHLTVKDAEYKDFLESIKKKNERTMTDFEYSLDAEMSYNPNNKNFNDGARQHIFLEVLLKFGLFGSKTKELFFEVTKEDIEKIMLIVFGESAINLVTEFDKAA
jgi:hypothetical protein